MRPNPSTRLPNIPLKESDIRMLRQVPHLIGQLLRGIGDRGSNIRIYEGDIGSLLPVSNFYDTGTRVRTQAQEVMFKRIDSH